MSTKHQLTLLRERAVKGVHLGLRQVAQAPEQRAARSLRSEIGTLTPTGPRVAVLSMRDWTTHVHWEAVIAQALRLRGADVHVITCGGGLERCDRTTTWEAPPMPCHSCSKYVGDTLTAYGLPQYPLSDGWSHSTGDWPELDEVSSEDLAAVEDEGLPLGRLVDIPVKWFLLSTRVHEDPLGAMTMRAFLRSGRRVARAVRKMLDDVRPDKVLLVNGLFLFESITRELCEQRGIDVVNYERGFITDTLLFSRERIACFGEMGESWAEFRQQPLTDGQRSELHSYLQDRIHGRRSIERYWSDVTFDEVPRRSSGRRVSLFTNLTWDSAVIGKEIAYPKIQDWLDASIAYFAGRPEDELVIRIHPAEVRLAGKPTREPLAEYIGTNYPTLPANISVIGPDDQTSSYPLMAGSDVVCVFTSTTGLEAALLGRPVVVAGQTHYRGKGFTIDVSDHDQYVRALSEVLEAPDAFVPNIDLVERYADRFFFGMPISSSFVTEHIQGLARLDATTVEQLAPGGHPGLDRICDGILAGAQFEGG